MNVVKVGMADLQVAQDPDHLRTTGLGSCVGVVLYDSSQRVGGLAHVMLPTSQMAKQENLNHAKFADTAIPLLIQQMEKAGARVTRMKAKLAGGAQMFAFASQSETMRIGARNVEACKAMLHKLGIPIVAEETGGNYGRTIELDCATGILHIRTINQGEKEV